MNIFRSLVAKLEQIYTRCHYHTVTGISDYKPKHSEFTPRIDCGLLPSAILKLNFTQQQTENCVTGKSIF